MNFRHVVEQSNIRPQTCVKFTVPNPKYFILVKQKKSTRFTSEYEALNTGRYYPFGSLYLDGYNQKLPLIKENTSIKLRPLQVPVFEKLKHEKGALCYAKTGTGKTVLTTALHEVWGGNMLVVVHSLDNVKYFHETFQDFIGVTTGMICSGEKSIGKVTVTTFNTFRAKYQAFANYKHADGTVGFDNLIIDEADAFFTEKARKAINLFPAIRKMAFTGTKKTDYDQHLKKGHPGALNMFYGRLVTAEEDKSKDPLEQVFYKKYKNNYTEVVEGKEIEIRTFEWVKFREYLDGDTERKRQQWSYIMENTQPQKHTLVLFDRIADVEAFYNKAQTVGIKSFMNHGSLKKKDREKTLQDFYEQGGYCFAQYRTMGRGYDNDRLTKCFILFPTKGENNIRQIVGRVVRWLDGKRSYVYTWYDTSLYRQHLERKKVFQEHFELTPLEL